MSFFDTEFDATTIEITEQEFEAIPKGWYDATIHSASLKVSDDATEERLNVRFDITGPTHAGRVIFKYITLKHPNADYVRRGLEQLAKMAKAINMPRIRSAEMLAGHRCKIEVGITEANGEKKAKNNVWSFAPAANGIPVIPLRSTTPQPPKPVSAGVSPPWAPK